MSTAAITVTGVDIGYARARAGPRPPARWRSPSPAGPRPPARWRRPSPARQRRVILAGINATLQPGELVCLIGPNGTGKSTLLRTLAGFQPSLGGEVRIADRPLTTMSPRELARHVAVVLTERVAVGQLRGYDLVALGRYPHTDWSGRLNRADHRIIRRALAETGATPLAGRPASELSDGERQRLMIARALAQEPRVLLLDEPTAFLDITGRLELTTLLLELAHDHGLAVLMSTHDIEHMLRHADRLWLIHDGGLMTGAPEDLGLGGHLQRALINTHAMHFDPYTGTVQTSRSARGAVSLHGDGDARVWTERALRRAGYALSDAATIEVTWNTDPSCAAEREPPLPHAYTRWYVRNGHVSHGVSSLGALVARLHELTSHNGDQASTHDAPATGGERA